MVLTINYRSADLAAAERASDLDAAKSCADNDDMRGYPQRACSFSSALVPEEVLQVVTGPDASFTDEDQWRRQQTVLSHERVNLLARRRMQSSTW